MSLRHCREIFSSGKEVGVKAQQRCVECPLTQPNGKRSGRGAKEFLSVDRKKEAMKMSMAKNGLLLAIGGMLGAFVAAVMTNDEVKETVKETAEACKEFAAMDRLIDTLRMEGEKALKVCTSDEEREAVYEKIRESVAKLKAELQERGEALIAEFRAKAQAETAGGEPETASEAEGHVENIRQTLARFSESLDETLRALNPQPPAAEG